MMFASYSRKIALSQTIRRAAIGNKSHFQRTNDVLATCMVKRNQHTAAAAVATTATEYHNQGDRAAKTAAAAMAAASLLLASNAGNPAKCEEQQEAPKKKKKTTKKKKYKEREVTTTADGKQHWHLTPADVAVENFDDVQQSHDIDSMPIYTSEQVAENNGENGKPIWMSYGGVVYDVTNFIPNHPGGHEKILTAAGQPIEPFWYVYRQHFASDLPIRLMEHMAIGRLKEEDQDEIEEQMAEMAETSEDPYAHEPKRDSRLIIHSDTPMNAETPANLLTDSYLTPASVFYLRHHHPVPYLTPIQLDAFHFEIDVTGYDKSGKVLTLTLADLKKMPKVEITSTLQCSGNRRSNYNESKRTSGTPWGQGAISTAKWGGVRLIDVLKLAGLEDAIEAQEKSGMNHVRFEAMDGMMASIPVEKAANPYGDVILAYEMNDEPLPADHGGPLRVIVPGFAAVRSVKWVNKIEVAKTEAEGPWQRGLNYKALPPNVVDANDVDLSKTPSMMEASLFSGITKMTTTGRRSDVKPGSTIKVKACGWAWAGGGRNVVRVDLTSDGGKTWKPATLKEGSDQKFGRAWAWTFWECEIPCKVSEDGKIEVASKAVDMALNSQPDKCDHTWNVRGLANNSWFRRVAKVC